MVEWDDKRMNLDTNEQLSRDLLAASLAYGLLQ
jgi:hypothetical protein